MFGKTSAGEPTAEDQVRLKLLWGIRPGVYLAALYSLILLGGLFFLLAFSGLTNSGSLGVFTSEPSGAAVRVDGVSLGTTPCKVFVPRGNREIELVLPGFTPLRLERDIPGPLLGAPFFPHREYIDGTLRAEDPLETLILAASEFAEWSFTGEPTAGFQIPPVLSEGAYRVGPAGAEPRIHRDLDRVLRGALRFAVTRGGLRDLLRAKFLIDNGGLSPSPLSVVRSLEEMAVFLAETPGASVWLAGLLPPEAEEAFTASAWYRKDALGEGAGGFRGANGSLGAEGTSPPALPAGGETEVGGLRFREMPSGALIRGTAFPRRIALEGFWIAAVEISTAAWEDFLGNNPRWRPENLQSLREQGLVTPDYLVPQDNPAYPAPAQSGVSWYAAAAYCDWFTRRLPPSLAAWEVRLPTEAEWEYAAKKGNAGGGLGDMTGSLWEWCVEPFSPLPFIPGEEDLIRRIDSPERPVKGGSWVSAPGSVGIESRGSLPPSSCSPFVGFRPVIARRGTP
jgi:hypothetical protein